MPAKKSHSIMIVIYGLILTPDIMKRVTPRFAASLISAIRKKGVIKKGFDIRTATLRDLPDLLTLGQECFSYNPPTRRELHHALTRGHMMIVILFDTKNGAMAGFDLYEFNLRNLSLYLNITCIAPNYRGKGLSRVLMRVCRAVADGAGCRSIRSHVAAGNDAMIHLLESDGHQRGERHANYYSNGKAALTYRLPLRADA